ncbi:hypothetical protein F0562_018382 [Nyssa sinensis]|uniref:Flavin-containing monooxygenase n=1 Tax=Nyssa sinensis TaxID=561372 RepID=A0A5J4Z901_9ASTE|nr:hypothetical protein F0562_018382 [Nyssa sinensis]
MSDDIEVYVSDFLVLATGENDEPYVPPLPGLSSFHGETIHSREYKSAKRYKDKRVLVVGKGNSGMEIAYDLSNFGAKASIVIRSPFHVMTKEMIYLGMLLLKNMPTQMVDNIIDSIASHVYGDLSKYGIQRPDKGPFYHKIEAGRSPVIDVGTIGKIKAEEIQVFPAITSITEKKVVFETGAKQEFDVIIFATGYKTIAKNWLKDYKFILNSDGTPKKSSLNHWKGENGLYCAGFSRMGLAGISKDAKDIAKDIKTIISSKVEKLN